MAIRAKFEADFSSFQSAVEKAELSLKSFETGANKVGASINKMADSFSGRKIIQEATLMTAAIEKMGGTTGLTDKELKRISATVGEAAAKMRAMGLEVPASMQKLADATAHVGTAASKSTSLLSGMAAQLAGMFSIGAVIAFGRSILQAGDQIQKMADQTGLSVQQVQKLQHIAGQSGTSIESLVGAVQNLQQRLGDDNSGASGAIKRLGLNLGDLKTQNPYQQMVTLAEGIKGIKDPTEQASAAAAIFGKSWKEILPAIKSGMEQVGNEAPQMADDVVKSLDRIGDALTKAKAQGIVWGATFVTAIEKAGFAVGDFLSKFNPAHFGVANSQLLKMQAALNGGNGLVGAFSQAAQGATKLAKVVGADVKPVLAATTEEEYRFNQRLMESVKANEAAAKAAKERADAILKMSKEGLGAEFEWQNQILLTKFKLEQLTVTETKLFDEVSNLADFIATHKGEMFPELPPGSLEQWKKAQKTISETAPAVDRLRKALSPIEEVLGGITAKWAEVTVVASRAIQAVSERLAKGDWVGAITAAAAALGGFIAKLFKSEESAKVSPLRDLFFKAAGGLDVLNPKVQQLTGNLALVKAVFDAKTVEQYNKAIAELTALFDFQAQAMQTLDETAKKYGLTIEELGPAWQRQELDKKAQELFKDYQILTSAGVDHIVVLEKMAGSVNEYVKNALKMGVEVPAAMRPMLEEMAKNGQLLDLNGNKIEDLEKSGISFSMTMTEGFRSLIDEVKKLTDIIARSLGRTIKDIPDVTVDIYGKYHPPKDMPKGGDMGDTSAAWGGNMAMGGSGRVTKPTLFLAGEAGPEDYAFSGANKQFGSGDSNMSWVEELKQEIRELRRDMPRAVRIAVATPELLAVR